MSYSSVESYISVRSSSTLISCAKLFSRLDAPTLCSASGYSEAVVVRPCEDHGYILVTPAFKAGIITVIARNTFSKDGVSGPLVHERNAA